VIKNSLADWLLSDIRLPKGIQGHPERVHAWWRVMCHHSPRAKHVFYCSPHLLSGNQLSSNRKLPCRRYTKWCVAECHAPLAINPLQRL